jgi:chromosomal replication initiation ATPase DnaA
MSTKLASAIDRYSRALRELEEAKAELDEITESLTPPPASVPIQAVQEVVAIYFRLPVHVMWSRAKHAPLSTARNIAMALSMRYAGSKKEEVAAAFRRTRECVSWADHSVSARHDTEATYRAMFLDIEGRVQTRLAQIAA